MNTPNLDTRRKQNKRRRKIATKRKIRTRRTRKRKNASTRDIYRAKDVRREAGNTSNVLNEGEEEVTKAPCGGGLSELLCKSRCYAS